MARNNNNNNNNDNNNNNKIYLHDKHNIRVTTYDILKPNNLIWQQIPRNPRSDLFLTIPIQF